MSKQSGCHVKDSDRRHCSCFYKWKVTVNGDCYFFLLSLRRGSCLIWIRWPSNCPVLYKMIFCCKYRLYSTCCLWMMSWLKSLFVGLTRVGWAGCAKLSDRVKWASEGCGFVCAVDLTFPDIYFVSDLIRISLLCLWDGTVVTPVLSSGSHLTGLIKCKHPGIPAILCVSFFLFFTTYKQFRQRQLDLCEPLSPLYCSMKGRVNIACHIYVSVCWPQCEHLQSLTPFKGNFQSTPDALMNDEVTVMNFSDFTDLSSFSVTMRELFWSQ